MTSTSTHKPTHRSTHKPTASNSCHAKRKQHEKDTLIESLQKENETLKTQILIKNRQIAEQQDELESLRNRSRTINRTTNNKYVVEQNINVFCKEVLDHISLAQIQAQLAGPTNVVPQFLKLKQKNAHGRRNGKLPNRVCAIYQVVVGATTGSEDRLQNHPTAEGHPTPGGHPKEGVCSDEDEPDYFSEEDDSQQSTSEQNEWLNQWGNRANTKILNQLYRDRSDLAQTDDEEEAETDNELQADTKGKREAGQTQTHKD